MTTSMLLKPGTLIRARGREWIILPDSSSGLLLARPVGGLDEEIAGILPEIEHVESASFPMPTRDNIGDFGSGYLLREAARLSTRAAAGPFRSFARIAVEPRPYQLVPLMMALRLPIVRLLIADDVGIGKTIEAGLIARELLDRSEIKRLAVLCPPHLAEQWQKELSGKFHIEAELVLSNTITRLERDLPVGVSVFDRYQFTIVSTDFIKGKQRAEDFALKCPEFVIVDEAHGCTLAGGVGRQRRFELVRKIASDPNRNIVLVTATPHSGNEEAFRSLLGLLDVEFAELPADISREDRRGIRARLARHLVQRRRADIRHYLEADTQFPNRKDKEETYTFSSEYRKLFDDVVEFAYEFVTGGEQEGRHRRVRYWSALALLRCIVSSPAAAAATLRNRAAVDSVEEDEIDTVGSQTVLDADDTDDIATLDFSPGSDSKVSPSTTRRKLLDFARRAEELKGESDTKLQCAVREIKLLLKEGFRPIVFCRFIDTAEYVAEHLRNALSSKVQIESVTGLLPPAEREACIARMTADTGQYVLVCTDCLSEGINLQQGFDSVFHYDLCWNPTRHEQREGRVDRFGQEKPEVRVITYYGSDCPIDGVILDVLIRKHKRIKSDLGVTVAVPGSSEQIARTLFEGALFRRKSGRDVQQLDLLFGDSEKKQINEIHSKWDDARDREKKSRSLFAQHSLDKDTVAAELANVQNAIGSARDVERFLRSVVQAAHIPITEKNGALTLHISNETPRALRQAIGRDDVFSGRFELPLKEHEVYLGRTSTVIEGLAGWTLDQALDTAPGDSKRIASRCGVISTSAVKERTTIIVARFRYQLRNSAASDGEILCEEIVPIAFTGSAISPQWLSTEESEALLAARPEANLIATAIDQQIGLLVDSLPDVLHSLDAVARDRAASQLDAHERIREALYAKGSVTIEPVLPADILGAYVLLPRL